MDVAMSRSLSPAATAVDPSDPRLQE
jgi:hypothetical protein